MAQYKRMWENKGHRPWWAALHVYALTKPLHDLTGFSYKKQIFVIDANAVNIAYLHIPEMEEATSYFCPFWKNKSRVDRYFQMLDSYFKKASRVEDDSKTTTLISLPDDKLISNIIELADLHGFGYLFVTQPQHVLPLENELHQLLDGNKNADSILATVTTTKLLLPTDKELADIARYREEWSTLADDKKVEILSQLSKTYGWFGGIEGEAEYGPEHYGREILNPPLEHGEMLEILADPAIQKLGNFIGILSNQRIWARWHGMYLRYLIKQCINELARRWQLPDLEYATLEEIEKYQKTKIINNDALLQRKRNGYVVTIIDGKVALLTGERALNYKELVKEHISYNTPITGTCANPGKVKGKVRIVSFASEDYHHQISQFQQGEILVTGMTRPQIVHLCRKASAIITDEGGIASHASIVSREFNVPCIVGTHIATKVLKTGDTVEIDAGVGFVRKVVNK